MIKERNSKIVVLYFYLNVFMYLFTPFFTNKQISNLTYLSLMILIIYSIFISKYNFNYTFIYMFTIISTLMVLNLLLVSYKYFVLVEFFTFLMIAFIPLFIITSGNVNYEFLIDYWFKLSKLNTIIYPIYIYLYSKSYIHYANIGYIAHINLIIQMYMLIGKKDFNVINILLVIINVLIGITIGSRGLLAASIAAGVGILLILPEHKGLKYYFSVIILGVSSLFVLINIRTTLHKVYEILTKYNIKSRNLYLFISQLEGASSEVVLTGRKYIYDVVLEYIKGRSGLPSGLGITRYITDDMYYYSHNVVLDFILVLGVFGTLIFTIWYIYRNVVLFKNKNIDYSRFSLYIILTISFWIQAIMGDYFINSNFFWTMISILMFKQKKQIKD